MTSNDESLTQQVKGEIDSLVKKDVDSVDSDIRYVAYGARLRTALRAGSRYIAYVSGSRSSASLFARSQCRVHTLDQRCWGSFSSSRKPQDRHRRVRHLLGLSSRVSITPRTLSPQALRTLLLTHPFSFFRSDIGYEGYKAYQKGPSPTEAANFSESTRIGMLVTKRAVFQSMASMCVWIAWGRNPKYPVPR